MPQKTNEIRRSVECAERAMYYCAADRRFGSLTRVLRSQLSANRPSWSGTSFALERPVALRFEWDAAKALANVLKHGVRFDEAETVFGDPLSKTISDPPHSVVDRRFVTTGMSNLGRLLVVVHADRDVTIRIISARPITAGERRTYEEENSS